MRKDIRRIVSIYTKKFGTRDPFKIAKELNIELQIGDIGSKCGCYMFMKNHRCILLNENLTENEMNLVMAHELAHAILHRKENCYFIRNKTLLLTTKNEIEANKFAVELLLPDELLYEYQCCTKDQLSRVTGLSESLIELRIRN